MSRGAGLLALALLLAATIIGLVCATSEGAVAAPIWRLARPGPARGGEGGLAAPRVAPSPTVTPTRTPTATPAPSPTPTRVVVSRAIFVDQDAQMMHIYENDVEIRRLPCSTGLPQPARGTPAWVGRVGRYVESIFSFGVCADDAWYLFRAGGDILIHGAPYTWVGDAKVYQDLDALGHYPSSHGCIRLRPEDARWLTEWDPRDVPIAISPLTREFHP